MEPFIKYDPAPIPEGLEGLIFIIVLIGGIIWLSNKISYEPPKPRDED